MIEDEAYPSQNIRLYPCDVCGRNFQQESLMKHTKICKKTAQKGRKIFDSGKQRADGSDVIYSKTKETKKTEAPSSNWREKHNEFIKTVRNARVVSEAIKTGAPLPKFEASAVPSDYVNCQFCGRNFSSGAAERHIPFCETQSKRQKKNNSASNPVQKVKPKIPLPGQKKPSSDAQYGGQYGHYQNENMPSSNGLNRQGYQSGISNKGYNSGNDRKPIKYDSNLYYESDSQDAGSYGIKSKTTTLANKNKQEQLLRTGRNTTNNELNNALARNRGQKESPMHSRDPSKSRYGNQPSPHQNGGGQRTMTYGRQVSQQNNENQVATAKFCHECGSEFPVKWARFCSLCGDRRL